MEKRQEALDTRLEVLTSELKRLKDDGRNARWEIERTLLRDYATKSEHETLLDHFKDFIRSNTKTLKNLVLKQEDNNQDTIHEFMTMFQRFIRAQNKQMSKFVEVSATVGGATTRVIQGGAHGKLPIATNANADILDSAFDHDEDSDVDKPSRSKHKSRSRVNTVEDDHVSASTSSSDDSSSLQDSRYQKKSQHKEKKYIEDILQENGETDDFDDIFKGHLTNIQNFEGYNPLEPNGEPHRQGYSESFIEQQQGANTEDDSQNREEISTQKLTQEFKESLQKDDKLKDSSLMSFFDRYSKDPMSVQNPETGNETKTSSQNTWEVTDEVKQNLNNILTDDSSKKTKSSPQDQEQTQETDKKSETEKVESSKEENTTVVEESQVDDTTGKGEPSTSQEASTADMQESQPSVDSTTHPDQQGESADSGKTTTPSSQQSQMFENFENYNFTDDENFMTRLHSYKQSGEFDQIKEKYGNDSERAVLQIKGNYYHQMVDNAFDFAAYSEEKKLASPSTSSEAASSSSNKAVSSKKEETQKTNNTTSSKKSKKKPRLKPWERKKKKEEEKKKASGGGADEGDESK